MTLAAPETPVDVNQVTVARRGVLRFGRAPGVAALTLKK